MSPFVVVAAAGLVMALGAAALAVLQLKQSVAGLARASRAAAERLSPLTAELQAETAVTGVEVEQLQTRVERWRRRRAGNPPETPQRSAVH